MNNNNKNKRKNVQVTTTPLPTTATNESDDDGGYDPIYPLFPAKKSGIIKVVPGTIESKALSDMDVWSAIFKLADVSVLRTALLKISSKGNVEQPLLLSQFRQRAYILKAVEMYDLHVSQVRNKWVEDVDRFPDSTQFLKELKVVEGKVK